MHVIMRAGLMAALLVACSDSHVTPDAPPPVPFEYDLGVFTFGQPERPDPPTVYIDGAPTTSISVMYGSASEAEGTMHLVELRYADQVIATWPVTVQARSLCTAAPLTKLSEGLAEYETGDLRQGGVFYESGDTMCHGDPSLLPNCPCTSSERCAVRVVRDTAPVFTHLRCTPIGTKQLGDACSFTPDPDGAYDDCGTNLICYDGTCHGRCDASCMTSCVQPDGYDNYEAFCM
jgi:hypothetical protein